MKSCRGLWIIRSLVNARERIYRFLFHVLNVLGHACGENVLLFHWLFGQNHGSQGEGVVQFYGCLERGREEKPRNGGGGFFPRLDF